MVEQPFERETILDITVNLVPFAMIIAFLVLFTIFSPWGVDIRGPGAIGTFNLYGLLLFKLLTLSVATYVAAKYMSRDEP